MRLTILTTVSVYVAASLFCFWAPSVHAQQGYKLPGTPDKAFSTLMIRLGSEAYERSKYGEARKYFRMAIASDPSSRKAWALYDRSLLAHMVYQLERTGNIAPYLPTDDLKKLVRKQSTPTAPQQPAHTQPAQQPEPASAPPPPNDKSPEGVVMGDDEGC